MHIRTGRYINAYTTVSPAAARHIPARNDLAARRQARHTRPPGKQYLLGDTPGGCRERRSAQAPCSQHPAHHAGNATRRDHQGGEAAPKAPVGTSHRHYRQVPADSGYRLESSVRQTVRWPRLSAYRHRVRHGLRATNRTTICGHPRPHKVQPCMGDLQDANARQECAQPTENSTPNGRWPYVRRRSVRPYHASSKIRRRRLRVVTEPRPTSSSS